MSTVWQERQAVCLNNSLNSVGKHLEKFYESIGDPNGDSKTLCENMCSRLDWMLVDELVWEARLDSCKKDVSEFEEQISDTNGDREEIKSHFPDLFDKLGEGKKTMRRHLLYRDMLEKINNFDTKKNSEEDIKKQTVELNQLKRKRSELEYVFEQRKKQCHALFTSINDLQHTLEKPIQKDIKETIDPKTLEKVDAEELKNRLIEMIKEDETLNHLAGKLLQGTSEGMQAQLESSDLTSALDMLAQL